MQRSGKDQGYIGWDKYDFIHFIPAQTNCTGIRCPIFIGNSEDIAGEGLPDGWEAVM